MIDVIDKMSDYNFSWYEFTCDVCGVTRRFGVYKDGADQFVSEELNYNSVRGIFGCEEMQTLVFNTGEALDICYMCIAMLTWSRSSIKEIAKNASFPKEIVSKVRRITYKTSLNKINEKIKEEEKRLYEIKEGRLKRAKEIKKRLEEAATKDKYSIANHGRDAYYICCGGN